jgi:hypothetical protein
MFAVIVRLTERHGRKDLQVVCPANLTHIDQWAAQVAHPAIASSASHAFGAPDPGDEAPYYLPATAERRPCGGQQCSEARLSQLKTRLSWSVTVGILYDRQGGCMGQSTSVG